MEAEFAPLIFQIGMMFPEICAILFPEIKILYSIHGRPEFVILLPGFDLGGLIRSLVNFYFRATVIADCDVATLEI